MSSSYCESSDLGVGLAVWRGSVAMLELGSRAFAVVWLVATIKDLPSMDFSWLNFGLATGAALLAMGGLALTQVLDRRASQP